MRVKYSCQKKNKFCMNAKNVVSLQRNKEMGDEENRNGETRRRRGDGK